MIHTFFRPWPLLALVAMLGGCEQSAQSAPAAARITGVPYELVVVMRPESVAEYFKLAKSAHSFCALSARALGLPVQPYVDIPADLELERTTYVSDGRSFRMDRIQRSMDVTDNNPDTGCRITLTTFRDIERTSNGRLERVFIHNEGQRETVAPESTILPPPDTDLALYTATRTENGVPLRCLGPDSPHIQVRAITAHCIVDAGNGKTLHDSNGEPIIAYGREVMSQTVAASPTVLSPVSMRIGTVNPALFVGNL